VKCFIKMSWIGPILIRLSLNKIIWLWAHEVWQSLPQTPCISKCAKKLIIYVGKSISKLQINIELKQVKSTDLKNVFISQHHLPVHWGTCPIVSQASENQQHKILWAAVRTRRWLPFLQLHLRQHAFGEESWSLPLNGLTKFPEYVTVEVGIYGLSLRLDVVSGMPSQSQRLWASISWRMVSR
jgi:hypothetical protein